MPILFSFLGLLLMVSSPSHAWETPPPQRDDRRAESRFFRDSLHSQKLKCAAPAPAPECPALDALLANDISALAKVLAPDLPGLPLRVEWQNGDCHMSADQNPVEIAVLLRWEEGLTWLLEHAAGTDSKWDSNAAAISVSCKDRYEPSGFISHFSALNMAIATGWKEGVIQLLKHGASAGSIAFGYGPFYDPLDFTYTVDEPELLELLVQAWPTLEWAEDRMAFFAKRGRADLLAVLRKHGYRWPGTWTNVLHEATYFGDLEVVKFLLEEGLAPDLLAYDGSLAITPLTYALRHCGPQGHAGEVVALFLSKGAHLLPQMLFDSAVCGSTEVLRKLITEGHLDPNTVMDLPPPKGRSSPLIVSAYACSASSLSALLSLGADPNLALPDGEGRRTALTEMLRSTSEGCRYSVPKEEAETLVRAVSVESINLRDAEGRTPLHWAVIHGKNWSSLITPLLDKGADLHAKDRFGKTPFEYTGQNP